MLQIFTYIISPFFHLYYGIVFLVTHPIQYIAHRVFGEKARLLVIKVLNFFLTLGLYIIGSRVKIKGKENLPNNDRPVIIVSNHQAFYDIPIIGHLFRKNNVKFVAKESLGKGIPTISYNLVHGKSALVNRENGGQSVREIIRLGRHIKENNFAACIYPEGTRSTSGKVQEFQPAGLATLLRAAPNAIIIPFAIKGHAELINKSPVWVKLGQKIEYTIFPAYEGDIKDTEKANQEIREIIKSAVEA